MTATDVINIAAGEIGYTESPPNSNKTKYGAWYGLDGEPWCMMFVQWCFDRAGQALPYKTASCSSLERWYRENRPKSVFKSPERGDIVIYSFGHTGIVESIEGDTITAIEGNTSADYNGSQNNGGGVYRRTRKTKLATAFLRPDYKTEGEDMTGEQIYKALMEYLNSMPFPDWAKEEMQLAKKLGITDGSDPMGMTFRYQAAFMAERALVKALEAAGLSVDDVKEAGADD